MEISETGILQVADVKKVEKVLDCILNTAIPHHQEAAGHLSIDHTRRQKNVATIHTTTIIQSMGRWAYGSCLALSRNFLPLWALAPKALLAIGTPIPLVIMSRVMYDGLHRFSNGTTGGWRDD